MCRVRNIAMRDYQESAVGKKNNFNVFSYDKTSLKFCESFRIFPAVFVEKF